MDGEGISAVDGCEEDGDCDGCDRDDGEESFLVEAEDDGDECCFNSRVLDEEERGELSEIGFFLLLLLLDLLTGVEGERGDDKFRENKGDDGERGVLGVVG